MSETKPAIAEALRLARKYSLLATLRDVAADGYILPIPVVPVKPTR